MGGGDSVIPSFGNSAVGGGRGVAPPAYTKRETYQQHIDRGDDEDDDVDDDARDEDDDDDGCLSLSLSLSL